MQKCIQNLYRASINITFHTVTVVGSRPSLAWPHFLHTLKCIFSFVSLERSWLVYDEHQHVTSKQSAVPKKAWLQTHLEKKSFSANHKVWLRGLRFDAAKLSCIQLGRYSLWHISKYKNDYRTQSEQRNNQHMTGLSSVPGVYVCSVKLFANCHIVIQPRAVRWQAIYLEP